MALADYLQLVDRLVRDQSGTVTSTDVAQAVELARLRYSGDCERTLVDDVTWLVDGNLGPLPAGWLEGAYLLDCEYPIGQQPASRIAMAVYQEPTLSRLMAQEALALGAVVRVTFAAPHALNDGVTPKDTIAAQHREAVASYAAAVLCKQLATHYSGERETSINVDHSNTDSRARNYAARARDYRAAYFSGIGKADPQADKGSGAATAMAGEPAASVSSWAGRSRTVIRTNDSFGAVGGA